jgi:hypothetical protein
MCTRVFRDEDEPEMVRTSTEALTNFQARRDLWPLGVWTGFRTRTFTCLMDIRRPRAPYMRKTQTLTALIST